MVLITYKFIIDDDVKETYKIYQHYDVISRQIQMYLDYDHGWGKFGYTFEPVLKNQKINIYLSTPKRIQKECGNGNLSCAEMNGKNIYLNAYRWFNGSKESQLNLNDYRQYMVSHEMGHILGKNHKKCPSRNSPAPIMMQQTFGIGECKPNIRLF